MVRYGLTPHPGPGRLSEDNTFEDTAFNSGVGYIFLSPLALLGIKYRDAVINLSTSMLIPSGICLVACSFLFFFRRVNSVPEKCTLYEVIPPLLFLSTVTVYLFLFLVSFPLSFFCSWRLASSDLCPDFVDTKLICSCRKTYRDDVHVSCPADLRRLCFHVYRSICMHLSQCQVASCLIQLQRILDRFSYFLFLSG